MGAGKSASEVAERKRAQARQLEQDARKWERGAQGERQIASVLAGLPADYVVFHDLQLPDSKANVDHLVIAPHGVYAIDTKNFSNPVTRGRGRGADKLWTGRQPIRFDACKWEASTTAALIGVDVTAMMCIIARSLPEPVFDFDGVSICDPKRLLANIANPGSQAIDVGLVTEKVKIVFGAEPEVREPAFQAAPPVRRAPRPALRPKLKMLRQPWFRLLLTMAMFLVVLAFLPTIMSEINRVSTAISERLVSDLMPVPASSPSTTTAPIAALPPVLIEASCPNPGNGWVISFGWPGDLPAEASAYSIRWQTDDGPIIRHDVGGWSDPTEPPVAILLRDGSALSVTTDIIDHEGHILASTPQLFETAETC